MVKQKLGSEKSGSGTDSAVIRAPHDCGHSAALALRKLGSTEIKRKVC